MRNKLIALMTITLLGGCSPTQTSDDVTNETTNPKPVQTSQPTVSSRKYIGVNLCTTEQLKNATGICYTKNSTSQLIINDFEKTISRVSGVKFELRNRNTKASSVIEATSVSTIDKRQKERGNKFRLDVDYGTGELSHDQYINPIGVYYYE